MEVRAGWLLRDIWSKVIASVFQPGALDAVQWRGVGRACNIQLYYLEILNPTKGFSFILSFFFPDSDLMIVLLFVTPAVHSVCW